MRKYRCGLENISQIDSFLKGKRIGFLTNPTSVDSELNSGIEIIHDKYRLERLFSPEHGARGEQQSFEKVVSYIDEVTGVYSMPLHGGIPEGYLDGLDCVIYDIQDVGLRHYTYPQLLTDVMKDCAEKKLPVIALDRYNPPGLTRIEGNIFEDGCSKRGNLFSLATRYAMPVGEFGRYVNTEFNINCELIVVPCSDLKRTDDARSLQVPWIRQSPNCPTYNTVLAYIGSVLFEGTNLTEGRGTVLPFEMIGAPWLKSVELVEYMKAKKIPGVMFRSVYFQPMARKFANELCRGIQMHITDPDTFESYKTSLYLIEAIKELNEEFEFTPEDSNGLSLFDRLAGTKIIRKGNISADEYIKSQLPLLEQFRKRCEPYYLYE